MTTLQLPGLVAGYPDQPLDRGLVAEWRFDRNTGLIIPDTSGNDTRGIVTGTAPAWVATAVGPALSLPGTDEYVNISPVGELLNRFEGTVEQYIYRDFADDAGTYFAFECRQDALNRVRFYYSTVGAGVLRYSYEANNVEKEHVATNAQVPNNTWTHLIGTWSLSQDATVFYVNGIAISALDTLGTWAVGTIATGSIAAVHTGASSFWPGEIALTRFYNRPLSAVEVRRRYEIVTARASGAAATWYPPYSVEDAAGSASASVSPSVSPSPSPGGSGEVVWGHDTGVLEANVRNFQGNWAGTGQIFNPGVADIEYVRLQAGELMISEIWDTGDQIVELLQNEYSAGDDVDLDYRHGATPAACVAAGWNNYTVKFQSLGYVQIRITSTL